MTHQYDQYAQEFSLTDADGTTLTPTLVEDVKILINDTAYSYSDGTLVYSSNKWYALLTQAQTDDERTLTIQCEVNFGNDTVFTTKKRILHSDIEKTKLSPSLDWSSDDD